MAELNNCPNCDKLFVKNAFREVCDACYKEEEKQFETVHSFIRQRENRAATIAQVVDGTGVPEKLILKFIKTGRLELSRFPGLGYPCDKCGAFIRKGKLCDSCTEKLRTQVENLQREQERQLEAEQREKARTYHSSFERK